MAVGQSSDGGDQIWKHKTRKNSMWHRIWYPAQSQKKWSKLYYYYYPPFYLLVQNNFIINLWKIIYGHRPKCWRGRIQTYVSYYIRAWAFWHLFLLPITCLVTVIFLPDQAVSRGVGQKQQKSNLSIWQPNLAAQNWKSSL